MKVHRIEYEGSTRQLTVVLGDAGAEDVKEFAKEGAERAMTVTVDTTDYCSRCRESILKADMPTEQADKWNKLCAKCQAAERAEQEAQNDDAKD